MTRSLRRLPGGNAGPPYVAVHAKRSGENPGAFSFSICLLDLKPTADGDVLLLLGQVQSQNAVIVFGLDPVHINSADVKAAGEGPEIALALDKVSLLVLFLLVAAVLGGDGQGVVVQVKLDVLLVKAGQLGLQLEGVAGVFHIGAESGGYRIAAPESAFKLLHLAEGVEVGNMTITALNRNDLKHNIYLQNFITDFILDELCISFVSSCI